MSMPVGDLLDAVMDLSPEEQEGYLNERCPDVEIRRQVLELLKDEHVANFLETPALEVLEVGSFGLGADSTPEDLLKTVVEGVGSEEDLPSLTEVAGYRLVKEIGSGGMGRVFLAEQSDPVERRVAIKLLKSSFASSRLLRRFLAEGQTMARLEHPNVARIYDAGTDGDLPYLVMEYIDGRPLGEYCDSRRLDLTERLRLFVKVCGAVHYSHLNRILHRDLKPSNVLVTEIDGKPTVKLIDFGIAKRLGPEVVETAESVLSGTPSYMSPEALAAAEGGPPVDARTDVYSLGVLLYELICGRLPFGKGWMSAKARSEREDPDPPSHRFDRLEDKKKQTIARQRSRSPASLSRVLKNDLDWIAVKAIAFDRGRRYESSAALGAEVQRFLSGKAVEARPPSALYRLRKWGRRNYGTIFLIALIFAALAGGLVARTIEASRTRQALNEAERARREERQMRVVDRATVEFMSKSMIASARNIDPFFRRQLIMGIVEEVRRKADEELVHDPTVHGNVLQVVANIASAVQEEGMSCELLREAKRLKKIQLEADHGDLIELDQLLLDCPADSVN